MTPASGVPDAQRVHFTDIQRFLSLFAQGLAGTFLHVKVIETHGMGAGASRIMDGKSIRLPADIADFTAQQHNLGAYRVAVLRQIGYLVEGTFEFDLAGFLGRHTRPALLRRVFATIEDMRIDAAILPLSGRVRRSRSGAGLRPREASANQRDAAGVGAGRSAAAIFARGSARTLAGAGLGWIIAWNDRRRRGSAEGRRPSS